MSIAISTGSGIFSACAAATVFSDSRSSFDLPLLGHQSSREQVMDETPGCRRQAGNLSPNIGRPMTSQCSASRPFSIRRMSTTTRFTGCRIPEKRAVEQDMVAVELSDQPAKLRAVGFGSARHIAEHRFTTGGLQLAHLCVNALAVRGYLRITVFHRVNYVHTHGKAPIFDVLIFEEYSSISHRPAAETGQPWRPACRNTDIMADCAESA